MHIAKEDDKQPRTWSDGTEHGLPFLARNRSFADTISSSSAIKQNSFGKREKDQGRKKRTRGDH